MCIHYLFLFRCITGNYALWKRNTIHVSQDYAISTYIMQKANNKNTERQGKFKMKSPFSNDIKRTENNCHISHLVQTFSFL